MIAVSSSTNVSALMTLTSISQLLASSLGDGGSSGAKPATKAAVSGSPISYGRSMQVTLLTAELRYSGVQDQSGGEASAIARIVRTYVDNNALSSQTISDTLYAGGSLPDALSASDGDSFATAVSQLKQSAASVTKMASALSAWLAAGRPDDPSIQSFSGMADDQVNDAIGQLNAMAARETTQANGMAAAFASHTLTLEKATDVQGLNYSEAHWDTGNVSGGWGSASNSEDETFVEHIDWSRTAMFNIGSVEMYASW